MKRTIKAMTLIELLISMVLLSMIILSISQIDVFSAFHVISATRRVKIDNEISLALEHMTKEITKAIGNEVIDNPSDPNDGADSVVDKSNIGGDQAVKVYIDYNQNGQKDADPPDRWIAYRFTGVGGFGNPYELLYCPNCDNKTCNNCTPGWNTDKNNTIARNIKVFTITKPTNGPPNNQLNDNRVTTQLTTCWDPATAALPNGTMENPCVDMKADIKLPSVSTN